MGAVAVGPCRGSKRRSLTAAPCRWVLQHPSYTGAPGKRCKVLSFPCPFPAPAGSPTSPAPRLKYLRPQHTDFLERGAVQITTKTWRAPEHPGGGRGRGARRRRPGVALRMTQQCRKETRCWWNRPLPLLHPICAPCLSNNIQNRRKIWTPHSL